MSRREDVDRRIYAAAMNLLRTHGPLAVTVEAVAAESGVARTTIYRRHKDRDAVLAAALGDHMASRVVEPGDDVWRDMRAAVESLIATLEGGPGSGVFLGLVQSGDRDQVELIRDKLLRPRIALAVERLRDGVATGQVRPDADIEVAVDLLLGAVAARFAHSGTFPPGWAGSVVSTLRVALQADCDPSEG
ncbi:TetR/AcrR family transcriptional regulator [Occultella aeris]|uniref:Bacterial regulatory proteins, tetR family n=1 Tax=Occultella aeris TaxID=2761496 RepID=A0A7M4DD93_9MICO|nr:TetR/AcrR family transcriptional regulator [Occultella aeris]VZO34812.1 Bacterial regulatory proteins, tetR family [Occultella aeris]